MTIEFGNYRLLIKFHAANYITCSEHGVIIDIYKYHQHIKKSIINYNNVSEKYMFVQISYFEKDRI